MAKENKKKEIITMFPTTVLKDEIGQFTKEELKEIDMYKTDIRYNDGNLTSNNQQVLTNEKLSRIKQSCIDIANEYMVEIMGGEDGKLNPEVCLSWVNWTENGGWHHQHSHPNAFLSGVVYVEAVEGDTINFYKQNTPRTLWIEPKNNDYNWYNALSWQFEVRTGDIIVFPSYIEHAVVQRPNIEGLRTSIAFNIFPRGEIGSSLGLSALTI